VSQIPFQQTSSVSALPEITWSRPATDQFSGRVAFAALLSVLVPGLGHLFLGERRKGLTLLGASLLSALILVAVMPREPFAVLAMFTQPRNLLALLLVDLALLLFRAYAVVDVVRGSDESNQRHPGMLAVLALLLAITAAPHVAVAYYDVITYQFLDNVFDGGNSARRQTVAPTEVQTTREVRLADGVNAAAPPVVAPTGEADDSSSP